MHVNMMMMTFDDACNGITDLIRAIIIALPSLPKGVITADWISENMMYPIEFSTLNN